MVTTIKKGASKAEILSVFSKLEKNRNVKKGFDSHKHCGKVLFEGDALSIQKNLRDEWE
jgi:hypothetical protein